MVDGVCEGAALRGVLFVESYLVILGREWGVVERGAKVPPAGDGRRLGVGCGGCCVSPSTDISIAHVLHTIYTNNVSVMRNKTYQAVVVFLS